MRREASNCLNPTVTIVAQATDNFVLLRGRRLPAIRGVVFGPDGAPAGNVDVEGRLPRKQARAIQQSRQRTIRCGRLLSKHLRSEGREPRHRDLLRTTSLPPAHELIGTPPRCKWGTSGLRLEVRPLIPVRLRVTEMGTNKPVERFGNWTMLQRGLMQLSTGGNMDFHENGLLSFEGLAATTRIVVWAEDEDLAPVSVLVEESQCETNPVEVRLARMQPFLVTLIDVRGKPVQTAFQVVDPCGATMAQPCNEPRTGSSRPPALPSYCPPAPPMQLVRQPCARLSTSANWSSPCSETAALSGCPCTCRSLAKAIRLVAPD